MLATALTVATLVFTNTACDRAKPVAPSINQSTTPSEPNPGTNSPPDTTSGEREGMEPTAASIGAAIGIAWPFGRWENPYDWVGWTGSSSGGLYTQTGCGYRSTHSGADRLARDLSRSGCYGVMTFAGFAGRIVRAGSDGGYGNTVVIYDQARHLALRYSHLSYIAVSVGNRVIAGQYIGAVGNSGKSTGPHLHLAAYENVNDNNGNPIIPTLCDSEYYTCGTYFYSW